jgi:hypothetical protein
MGIGEHRLLKELADPIEELRMNTNMAAPRSPFLPLEDDDKRPLEGLEEDMLLFLLTFFQERFLLLFFSSFMGVGADDEDSGDEHLELK